MSYLWKQRDQGEIRATRSDIIYGLSQLDRDIVSICPPFLTIFFTVYTSTYKLATFLVPILKFFTSNDYTAKDLFAFAEEILDLKGLLTFDIHCVKSVQIWNFFWSIFSCIRSLSGYRKIRTRKNFVFGHFSCSD